MAKKTKPVGNKRPTLSESFFLAIDVEKIYKPDDVKKKISIVADELRAMGVDIGWVVSPPDQTDFFTHPVDTALPKSKDVILEKIGSSAVKNGGTTRHLLDNNKRHVIVSGFAMASCVRDTMADLLADKYHVTLLMDCTDLPVQPFGKMSLGYKDHEFLQVLTTQYSRQFRISTSMDFLRHAEKESGIKSRLLALRESLPYRSLNKGDIWRFGPAPPEKN